MPKPTGLDAQIATIARKLKKAKDDLVVIHHDILHRDAPAEKATRLAHQRAKNHLGRRQDRQGVLRGRVELYQGEIAELRKLMPEED